MKEEKEKQKGHPQRIRSTMQTGWRKDKKLAARWNKIELTGWRESVVLNPSFELQTCLYVLCRSETHFALNWLFMFDALPAV